MAKTVSDFLVQRLADWGVRRIFGYPGDGINGVFAALQAQDTIDFVQARHEELAAFMACAHAKFTGEVGVCIATSGPGAIHLLNGLYDAKMDHQPVVALVGQAARFSMGADFQQEVDLDALFKDVAGEYVQTCIAPEQIRTLIDRAMRIAKAERTVTCIILPKDVQECDYEEAPRAHGETFTGIGYSAPRVVPYDTDLRRAADVLNAGRKVAMLIGAGCLNATDEVLQVADLLGAGIAKALLGKAAVPDDLPFVTGAIGLLGTKPSWDLMMDCDTLLMVGSNFPYAEFLPKAGQAQGVQIDIAPRNLSLRYPMTVDLCGDAKETLQALIPLLDCKTDRSWRERIERGVADWWGLMRARAMLDANPVNPQRVYWELSPLLPDNVMVTCDSGTSASWYARDLVFRRGMMGTLSGSLATMGCGMPYAVAAKFAYPDRPVLALVGDGAIQMNGLNSLITVQKYWHEWADPRLIVLILHNNDLNQVTWEMRAMTGIPEYEASQELPDFPYARYAELLGFKGLRVDSPDQIAAAWHEAFSADRPVVIDAITDPDVPPLPPHISFDQAKSYAAALLKGDPKELGIIVQSLKGLSVSFLPHRQHAPKSKD